MNPTIAKYTFLPRAQGAVTETDPTLDIITYVDTLLMLKMEQNTFSDQLRLKLETDNSRNT